MKVGSKGLWVGASALALTIAACSRSDEGSSSESLSTYDVAAEPAAAPGIVPTAAPGVAFTYNYGFRLADDRVSEVQEAHAEACEKLGLERCRITGMTYELDEHERVRATLAMAVDPLLARGFGKDAIAEVTKADGTLRFTRIEGADQNPALDEAARRQKTSSADIERLEAQLAKAKGENERVQLREQIRQLRAELESAKQTEITAEARIQRTPMTFTYLGSSSTGRGFAGENPAKDAWYLFVDSVATMVSVVLKGLAVLLPWAVLLALLVAIARSRLAAPVRRWWKGQGVSNETQE